MGLSELPTIMVDDQRLMSDDQFQEWLECIIEARQAQRRLLGEAHTNLDEIIGIEE